MPSGEKKLHLQDDNATILTAKTSDYSLKSTVDYLIDEYLKAHPNALLQYQGNTSGRNSLRHDLALHQGNAKEYNNNNDRKKNECLVSNGCEAPKIERPSMQLRDGDQNHHIITSTISDREQEHQRQNNYDDSLHEQDVFNRDIGSLILNTSGNNNAPNTVVATFERSQEYSDNAIINIPPPLQPADLSVLVHRQLQHNIFCNNNNNSIPRQNSVTIPSSSCSSRTAIYASDTSQHHCTATTDGHTNTNLTNESNHQCMNSSIHPLYGMGVLSDSNRLLHMLILAGESSERNNIETLYWQGVVEIMPYFREVFDRGSMKENSVLYQEVTNDRDRRTVLHEKSKKEGKSTVPDDESLLNRSVVFVHGEKHTADQNMMLLVQWRGADRQECWMPLDEVKHFAVVDAYLNRYVREEEIEESNIMCWNDTGDMVGINDNSFSYSNSEIYGHPKSITAGIREKTFEISSSVIDELEWDDMQQQLANIQRSGRCLGEYSPGTQSEEAMDGQAFSGEVLGASGSFLVLHDAERAVGYENRYANNPDFMVANREGSGNNNSNISSMQNNKHLTVQLPPLSSRFNVPHYSRYGISSKTPTITAHAYTGTPSGSTSKNMNCKMTPTPPDRETQKYCDKYNTYSSSDAILPAVPPLSSSYKLTDVVAVESVPNGSNTLDIFPSLQYQPHQHIKQERSSRVSSGNRQSSCKINNVNPNENSSIIIRGPETSDLPKLSDNSISRRSSGIDQSATISIISENCDWNNDEVVVKENDFDDCTEATLQKYVNKMRDLELRAKKRSHTNITNTRSILPVINDIKPSKKGSEGKGDRDFGTVRDCAVNGVKCTYLPLMTTDSAVLNSGIEPQQVQLSEYPGKGFPQSPFQLATNGNNLLIEPLD